MKHFPYWTNVLWTLFCIELMYCGHFSVLNWYIVDLYSYWSNILWTLLCIELIVLWILFRIELTLWTLLCIELIYWTNILWTLFRIKVIYWGPFSILNGYIVDRNPYWTNISWSLFLIELIYCGPLSKLK